MKIGFIGAGKMGLPVCRRLKAAGHDVTALARNADRSKQISEAELGVAFTVKETIKGADVIFTSVSDDQALREVVSDNNFTNAAFIDLSTVSPSASEKIATLLPKSVGYLRSPVSGSTVMAEAGTLTALVSGPRATFDAMELIFAAFTKKAFHLGEHEEARYLKLSINSVLAAMSALMGEALAFGLKGGLTHEAMMEVITQSAIASPLLGYKKDMIISGNYRAAATLDMLKKDVELFLATAKDKSIPMPLNTLVKDIYTTASANGLGEKDFFVLVDVAEKAAGLS